jgi:hypothetical protein
MKTIVGGSLIPSAYLVVCENRAHTEPSLESQ